MAKPKNGAPAPQKKSSKLAALPVAAEIPAVPDGAKPLDAAAKQGLLKIYTEQRAEVEAALDQICQKSADLAKDLGTLAPDPKRGKALRARLVQARAANQRAQALAAYTDDQEALAGHDVMSLINEVGGDIEHMAQKSPQIAARYDKVLAVLKQRREAIAAGIARAKASKAAEQKVPAP